MLPGAVFSLLLIAVVWRPVGGASFHKVGSLNITLRDNAAAQKLAVHNVPSRADVHRAGKLINIPRPLQDVYLVAPLNPLWRGMSSCLAIVTAVVFSVLAFCDIQRFTARFRDECQDSSSGSCEKAADDSLSGLPTSTLPWPCSRIVCLTFYRFYTGFLSATWMPYLLAMEGEEQWKSEQSCFMGLAKLIYGVTVLLNPLLGHFGDQAAKHSQASGRRVFVYVGVSVALLGIVVCEYSAEAHFPACFMSGLVLWRLGEAVSDVTIEALVPEMVPKEQFQLASGIKACGFLLGGVLGYVALIATTEVKYSWLYSAYPIGMILCVLPMLPLLKENGPMTRMPVHPEQSMEFGDRFIKTLTSAYVTPASAEGAFPMTCLAVFVFSLGTAPMFFLLLIIRDIVGVHEHARQQTDFAYSSISFFLCAAFAAAAASFMSPSRISDDKPKTSAPFVVTKVLLLSSVLVFGVVVASIPFLAAFRSCEDRIRAFYCLTVVLGAAFGTAFSSFQNMCWQVLPAFVNVGTAMGLSVMSRLFGLGLGNFVSGMLLETSVVDGTSQVTYGLSGYVLVSIFSSAAVFISAGLSWMALARHGHVKQLEVLTP